MRRTPNNLTAVIFATALAVIPSAACSSGGQSTGTGGQGAGASGGGTGVGGAAGDGSGASGTGNTAGQLGTAGTAGTGPTRACPQPGLRRPRRPPGRHDDPDEKIAQTHQVERKYVTAADITCTASAPSTARAAPPRRTTVPPAGPT